MKTIKYFGVMITLLFMLTALQVGNVSADETITVQLQNSEGTLLTGGALRYHDGAWHTATEISTGVFEVTTSATSVTYEMTYNNGRQTLSNVPSSTNPVTFTTVTTTVSLKDSGDTSLGTTGTVRYHQVGWQDFGTSNSAKELLPGSYTFEMTFNNGRQTFSNHNIPAGASHEVAFTTVTTTVALKDSDGISLGSDGAVRYHQVGWQDFGVSNSSKELLPGDYTFEMTYNNGKQTYSNYTVPPNPSHEVLFTTVTTTVALKDSNGTSLGSDGAVRYHQVGWQDFGTSNSTKELLPGDYTFEMTYNNGRQTFSNYTVPADASHEVPFATVPTTVSLKDLGGTSLGSGGTVRYHQVGWQDFGTSNSTKELLPGSYTFEMTFNNGRQTISNHDVPAGASHEVAFVTTTTTVRLATCADGGLDGGSVRYYQVGWQTYGTTVSGNVTRELLPGNYTFEMTYNNGRQTFSNVAVAGASQAVPFTTTVVTFDYTGVIQYHQLGWANFNKPTMDLLPGTYTFKFDTLTVSDVAISGCTMNSGTLTVNFPGISSVHTYVKKTDGVAGTANGTLVKQLTYKNNAAVFTDVPNGVYDVVVVKGAQTKIIDNVILIANKTVDGIVATMTVNFPGISSVHTYVKTTDGGRCR